jgi:hypothetical protein
MGARDNAQSALDSANEKEANKGKDAAALYEEA